MIGALGYFLTSYNPTIQVSLDSYKQTLCTQHSKALHYWLHLQLKIK